MAGVALRRLIALDFSVEFAGILFGARVKCGKVQSGRAARIGKMFTFVPIVRAAIPQQRYDS